jgi:hypothetical protein
MFAAGYLVYEAMPRALRDQRKRIQVMISGHTEFAKVRSPRAANAVECHLEWLAESSPDQGNVR